MSRENAIKSIRAVNDFIEQTSILWNQYEHQPLPNSQAAKELEGFSRPESIGTAYSQGTILLEVTADYAFAVAKTLSEPAETIAPWPVHAARSKLLRFQCGFWTQK